MIKALLNVKNLNKTFLLKQGRLQAVHDVSFSILPGETFGLAGESGCGKSTIGKLLLRLIEPTSGSISFQGEDLKTLSKKQLKAKRKDMQLVFQNPSSSLNPKMTAQDILLEPFTIHGIGNRQERQEKIENLLLTVGLDVGHLVRLPGELSGGQKQRLAIARALALQPTFIVFDEPLSALDVSIQAQIVEVLKQLKQTFGLTYLFISHDLAVMRRLVDRIAIMYLGQIVEISSSQSLYDHPQHPYTQALLSAILLPDPVLERKRKRIVLTGDLPSPFHPPSGCYFHTRCPFAKPICQKEAPPFIESAPGQFARCHFAGKF